MMIFILAGMFMFVACLVHRGSFFALEFQQYCLTPQGSPGSDVINFFMLNSGELNIFTAYDYQTASDNGICRLQNDQSQSFSLLKMFKRQ